MHTKSVSLPARQWSIVALGSLGLTTVLLSYVVAFVIAVACLLLPVLLLWTIRLDSANMIFARLLLSVFGLVAGLTILWSLIPRRSKVDVNGALIDLAKEKRLAAQLQSIAAALDEPMPSEVYLIADANAFVVESGGFFGLGRRRILALGLPLLQMLTIAQFRAVLAHEFAHYYGGDTRLGPWVYNARSAILRVYENLGRKSDVIRFLTRWAVVAIPYMALMASMRGYWQVFMRINQWISRRQEYRCDELACHVAGSQALAEGLQGIRKCAVAVNPYWNSEVLPLASEGFRPPLADGFQRFLEAPGIAKAAMERMEKLDQEKPSPMDTHPPMRLRIDRAKLYNLPAPSFAPEECGPDAPMISLIDDLPPLEAALLKVLIPKFNDREFRSLPWESAGMSAYVPMWRKRLERYAAVLSNRKLEELPLLLREPRRFPDLARNIPASLNADQSSHEIAQVLFCALALCMIDNGWTLVCPPGVLYLQRGNETLDPTQVISQISSGKLTPLEWCSQCAHGQMNDWPLSSVPSLPAAQ